MTRGVNFEHEASLTRARVRDPVGAPSGDHQSVARSEHSVLASGSEPDRAGQALMIITSVEAFETLATHSRLGIDETAEVLARMAGVLLREV